LSKVEQIVDSIPSTIDDLEFKIRADGKDDAIRTAAKASNLAAFMSDVEEGDMDLGDLLTTAGELSNMMKGLVGDTTSVALELGSSNKNLSQAAESALELDGLLGSLGGGWADPNASEDSWANSGTTLTSSSTPTTTTSNKIKERMDKIRPPSADPFAQAPAVSLANAKSFEDITSAVAYNIHKQSRETKIPNSATGQNVASELANIASATRSGNKQQLLLSAKAAAGQIQAFAKELEELAAKIPGKTPREKEIQSQLRRTAMGMKNYGMQLKILASVKAASTDSGGETDMSLGTIVTDLGDLISTSLSTINAMYTSLKF